MLDNIKRWLSREAPDSQWADASRWAKKQGWQFKRTREDDGFVVDGSFASRPWRLEWGPPQRSYITGHELRLRMELRLPSSLQMLLMSRALMETLERETFERYTETMQTQIDVATPEEMRWLAMFPKVPLTLPREVRGHFAAVASEPDLCNAWLDADLVARLAEATKGFLRDQPPFVLMTLRGRVYLRLQLTEPDLPVIGQAVQILDAAVHSAMRVASGLKPNADEWPSTGSTAWQTHLSPDDASRRRR